MPKYKMPKAPSGLTIQKALAAPKHLGGGAAMKPVKVGSKMPTLKDFKATVPAGGLMNKGLRQSYGKVPGLDT